MSQVSQVSQAVFSVHQITIPNALQNYVFLVRYGENGECAVVDPENAACVLELLEQLGGTLTHILITHHHGDHVGGNLELKEQTGCQIVGALSDADSIPGIDRSVSEGDIISLGPHKAQVIETPGHTRGHIAYWFDQAKALFCGDTLFSIGCGRLFEGTPAQMWESLCKLRNLPDDTKVFCGHEFTESNGRFALSIDPDNVTLQERMADVEQLRRQNKPTIPSLLGQEKQINPFLRADKPEMYAHIGKGEGPVETFAEIPRLKDCF